LTDWNSLRGIENMKPPHSKPPLRSEVVARPPVPPGFVEAELGHAPWPRQKSCYWDTVEKYWFQVSDSPRSNGADSGKDLSERLTARIYSSDSKPQEPAARFHLAGVSVCTPGNLTAISAAPKAGKTAAIGAMIAATFAKDNQDCLGWTSDNAKGLAVVHLDTEQCPFDHWQLIYRAMRRAGASVVPDWLRSYCVTGFSCADIRDAVKRSLDMAAQEFGGIHSFILDGAADAIGDVNSPEESNEFVSELHALAIEYDCPIIGVIHLNPGTQKTRGHLGSQLERKAETNLQLSKDEDEITTIWADKNRRASIPKKSAPCFAWDDSRHMHVTAENQAEAKADARHDLKLADMRQDAGGIFAQGKQSALTHGDMVARISKAFDLKIESGARRRLENWLKYEVVTKNKAEFYELAK
jgi:hypothetical protein